MRADQRSRAGGVRVLTGRRRGGAARFLGSVLALATFGTGWLLLPGRSVLAETNDQRSRRCPAEMVEVRGFCIDRYEISTVDKATGEALSPYYPPHRVLMRYAFEAWDLLRREVGPEPARRMPLPRISEWQRTHKFEPKAVSLPGKVPQAYMSYPVAKRACENAGKRLCTQLEWDTACRGERYTTHPYGNAFRRGPCNIYRYFHPAHVLHGASYFGHLDPRLNLLMISGDEPVLRVTGASQGCASPWRGDAVFDMVGNLDEWIDDEHGSFRGGFYARSSTKGCEASIASHGPTYYDYSTGARCCQSL